jgi:hypothetical protein
LAILFRNLVLRIFIVEKVLSTVAVDTSTSNANSLDDLDQVLTFAPNLVAPLSYLIFLVAPNSVVSLPLLHEVHFI